MPHLQILCTTYFSQFLCPLKFALVIQRKYYSKTNQIFCLNRQSKHSARVGHSTARSLSSGQKRPPQMCTLNETWDVKHTRNPTPTASRGPMDISDRKSEFHRELLYTKQRKQQMSIRTSETPREDEGILDWLLRSVTAVPLGIKKYCSSNSSKRLEFTFEEFFTVLKLSLQKEKSSKNNLINKN